MKKEYRAQSGISAPLTVGLIAVVIILLGGVYIFTQKSSVPSTQPVGSTMQSKTNTAQSTSTTTPSSQAIQQTSMTKDNSTKMSDIDTKLNALDTDSTEVDQSIHDKQVDVTSQ